MVGLCDKNNSLSIDVVVLVTLWYGIECGKLVCIIYHKYSKCVEKVNVDYFQKISTLTPLLMLIWRKYFLLTMLLCPKEVSLLLFRDYP